MQSLLSLLIKLKEGKDSSHKVILVYFQLCHLMTQNNNVYLAAFLQQNLLLKAIKEAKHEMHRPSSSDDHATSLFLSYRKLEQQLPEEDLRQVFLNRSQQRRT